MPRFEAADGTGLHYTDEGGGTPILCLAGLTRNGSDFRYAMPALAGARVIRPDYRGRGKSDWADPATYTIPQEAQDALALLDHLEIGRAAILGTSRGGLIAMVLAATAKERLTGVALVDIGPELNEDGLEIIRGYIGRNPPQKTYAEAVEMRATLLKGFEDVPRERWEAEVRTHYRETAKGLEINYDPRLREAVLAPGAQPAQDLWPLFEALAGLPLALIRGANSDLLSDATADRMAARRPDMIRADVPGRGHVPFLDEPEAVEALRRWIECLP